MPAQSKEHWSESQNLGRFQRGLFKTWVGWVVAILVVLVVISGGVIAYNATIGRENIKVNNQNNRIDVQGSPQYVEGQKTLMRNAFDDWTVPSRTSRPQMVAQSELVPRRLNNFTMSMIS